MLDPGKESGMAIGEAIHEGGGGQGSNIPASIGMGKVIKNWDSSHPGMVKVSIFAEAGESVDSDWMPVAVPYAAKGCGLYAMPEVGSIAIIGYVDDNSVSPVVIGTIWNQEGTNKISLPSNTSDKDNSIKVFCTPKGHAIRIEESSGKQNIEIITANKQRVFLDDKNGFIELSSGSKDNMVKIDGKGGTISVEAKKEISFKVGGKNCFKATSSEVVVKSNKFSYDGNSLQLKGKQTKIEGTAIEVKSQGNLAVQSSGVAQVKGSVLKLN